MPSPALHLLRLLAGKPQSELRALAAGCYDAARDTFTQPVLAALLAECALLGSDLLQGDGVHTVFPADAAPRLAARSARAGRSATLSRVGQADKVTPNPMALARARKQKMAEMKLWERRGKAKAAKK